MSKNYTKKKSRKVNYDIVCAASVTCYALFVLSLCVTIAVYGESADMSVFSLLFLFMGMITSFICNMHAQEPREEEISEEQVNKIEAALSDYKNKHG